VQLNSDLGTTLLLVTHDPDVAATAGRQLKLVQGKLVDDRRAQPTVAMRQDAI
jgi:putative ABC transport system ATP-binding protein